MPFPNFPYDFQSSLEFWGLLIFHSCHLYMLVGAVSSLRFTLESVLHVNFFVAAGTPEDKLRLFIINLICGSPMSDVCDSCLI